MRRFLFLALVSCSVAPSILAGPNAGGILVAHDADLLVSATVAGPPVCSQGVVPGGAASVDSRIDGIPAGDGEIFKVYAIFPEASSARLLGVVWGLAYDPGFTLSGFGACGDFEMAAAGWPGSGTGTTITWNAAQTTSIVPLYWFAAYATGAPATLDLTPEATQGGYFGDDGVPAAMDPVAGYGRLGFDTDGYVPPSGGEAGACCQRLTAACSIATAVDCGSAVFLGPGIACAPDPCAARTGACCDAQTTSCADMTHAHCDAIGGAFLGLMTSCALQGGSGCQGWAACCQGSVCAMTRLAECPPPGIWEDSRNCVPQPCVNGLGSCCNATSCSVSTETGCAYVWLAATSCTPLPCAPAPGLGACCTWEGCQITDPSGCSGPVWVFNWDCNPSPCWAPGHPCCDPDGMCRQTTEDNCVSPSVWHEDWIICGPTPCPQPPAGACCDPNTGVCRLATQYTCAYPDTWQGVGAVCSPNPCPQPSPLRVCCALDLSCTLVLAAQCPPPSVWHEGTSSCAPDPCGPGGDGACCRPDGFCMISTAVTCATLGVYLGADSSCNPNPCAQSVPVERTSWGRIKRDYR